jgi:hypothetical protein
MRFKEYYLREGFQGKANSETELLNSVENGIFTLDGSHLVIKRGFGCENLGLKSLAGCPQRIEGNFECNYNLLTSLKGGPTYVDGDYNCSHNKLISPLVGAPDRIYGTFMCQDNELTTLDGIPLIIDDGLYASNNDITTLHNIHKFDIAFDRTFQSIDLTRNPVKSHILGLLKIKNEKNLSIHLKTVDQKAYDILMDHNRFGISNDEIMQCQTALIEAGFREYAKL